jgi:N-alpha-acetyltransferase 38, NatC auxiliary subunit
MSTSNPSLHLPPPPPTTTTKVTKRTNSERTAINALRNLLGSTLRISIQDTSNRVFLGTFVCTDKARNIVLANAEEYRIERVAVRRSTITEGEVEEHGEEAEETFEQKGRYVGMVMIPWRYIIDVEEEDTSSSLADSVSRWII